jgi:hypothetical protein
MKPLRTAVGVAGALCTAATVLSLVNLRHLRRPSAPGQAADLSVLIPARDEAERIGPTLRSLQDLRADAEILVLDDDSSDGTGGLVRAAGFTVIDGEGAPPAGWLGKPWACQRLADASHGTVLVFLDADVELAPGAARRAAALLDDVDLVCPYPRQIATGALQRLVQPLLQWSWLTFLPLRVAERSAHPMLSAGNGQFLLVRREAYLAAGGHAAVRDQVLEDLALVRRVKQAGFRVAMADGTYLATCHMYADAAGLVDGYTKSLHDAFGPATIALLGFMYLLPPAAMVCPDRRTRLLGAAGYAAAVLGRLAVAGRMGQRRMDTLAHPASVLALGALYLRSVRARRRGTITWRGRPLP